MLTLKLRCIWNPKKCILLIKEINIFLERKNDEEKTNGRRLSECTGVQIPSSGENSSLSKDINDEFK